MARSEEQKELRRVKYKDILARGFSTKDARALRDKSSTNIVKATNVRHTQIRRTSRENRTPQQSAQLTAIRIHRATEQADPSRIGDIQSTGTREDQWSRWSSPSNDFPASIKNQIIAINRDSGKLPFDSFGYRMFYFMYVEGLDATDAMEEMIADSYVDIRN